MIQISTEQNLEQSEQKPKPYFTLAEKHLWDWAHKGDSTMPSLEPRPSSPAPWRSDRGEEGLGKLCAILEIRPLASDLISDFRRFKCEFAKF